MEENTTIHKTVVFNTVGAEQLTALTSSLENLIKHLDSSQPKAKALEATLFDAFSKPSLVIEALGEKIQGALTLDNVFNKIGGMVTGAASGIASSFGSAFTNVRSHMTQAASAVGNFAMEGGKKLLEMGKQAMEAAANLQELSDKSKVTVEDLSVMKNVAEENGSSMEAVGAAFEGMGTTLESAMSGNADAIGLFEKMGVSFEELQTKSPRDLFLEMSTAIGGMKDPTEAATLAQKMFGAGSQELLPTMKALAGDGFKKAADEANKFGTVVSGSTAEQAKKFDQTMDNLKKTLQGSVTTMVAQVMPGIDQLTATLGVNADNGWTKWLSPVKLVGMAMQGIIAIVIGVIDVVKGMGSQLGIIFDHAGQAATAFKEGRYRDIGGIMKNMWAGMKEQAAHDLDNMLRELENVFKKGMANMPNQVEKVTREIADPKVTRTGGGTGRGTGTGAGTGTQVDETNVVTNIEAQAQAQETYNAKIENTVALTAQVNANQATQTQKVAETSAQFSLMGNNAGLAGEVLLNNMLRINSAAGGNLRAAVAQGNSAMQAATTNGSQSIMRISGEAVTGMKQTVEKGADNYVKLVQSTVKAGQSLFKDVIGAVMTGGDLEKAFKTFATNIANALTNSLSSGFDQWFKDLEEQATLGKPIYGDPNDPSKVTGREAPSAGARAAVVGLQAAGAAYGIYSSVLAGGSRTSGTLSGTMSGMSIGAYVGSVVPGIGTVVGAVVGAVIGTVVGAIVSGIAAQQKRDQYKYGVPYIGPSGGVSMLHEKNMNDAEVKQWLTKIHDAYQTFWNGYVNVLLKLPGAQIPKPQAIMGRFQPEASANYLKHLGEWLEGTLPDEIAKQFKKGMETAFVNSGIALEAFNKFWDEADRMDPKKAIQFWSDLAEGINSFHQASTAMANVKALGGDYSKASFLEDGSTRQEGDSDFVSRLKTQTQGIFDIARSMINLTGPEKAAAWKQLGASVEGVMGSLTEYLNRVGQSIRNVNTMIGDALIERQLLQFKEVRNEKGEVIRKEDKEGAIELLHGQLTKVYLEIQNAKANGLTPEAIEALVQKALALQDRIYSMDPSIAGEDWLISELKKVHAIAQAALDALGKDAESAVDALLKQLEPFTNFFTGLPVDLDAAWELAKAGFPGFAAALAELTQRVNDAVPKTPPGGEKPGPGGPDGPGLPDEKEPRYQVMSLSSAPLSSSSATARSMGGMKTASMSAEGSIDNVVSLAEYLDKLQAQRQEVLLTKLHEQQTKKEELEAKKEQDMAAKPINVTVNVNGATIGVNELQSNVTRAAVAGVVAAIRSNPSIIEHPFAGGG